jgi:hypothetical protein
MCKKKKLDMDIVIFKRETNSRVIDITGVVAQVAQLKRPGIILAGVGGLGGLGGHRPQGRSYSNI